MRLMRLLPLCMLAAACGGPAVPDHEARSDRVDSLDISLEEGVLRVRLYSSFGIGSCLLTFSRPIQADSLALELFYSGVRPYSICEELEVVAGFPQGLRRILQEERPVELMDGRRVIPLGGVLDELRVTWVDYFRS